MANYQAYKNSVKKVMTGFVDFANKNEYTKSAEIISESKNKLDLDQIIIMTCGELKMGKSSMLCALLNDDELFPVDVDAATCLTTMVQYGEREKITVLVEDDDGQVKEIEIGRRDIEQYANEQNNRHNQKKAKMLKIELPNEMLKDGFVFVDTPGIGSLNAEHSEVTYSFLPQADLILFVSDSAAPYYAPELAFMKNAYKFCKNMIFVMTKKDMQHSSDIIDKKKAAIKETLGISKDEQVFIPISSMQKMRYHATEDEDWLEDSNFPKLEEAITKYVTENRADIVIMPRLAELSEQIKSIEADIIMKETALSGDSEKIELIKTKLEEMKDRRQALLSESANWQLDITSKISTLNLDIDMDITEFQMKTSDIIKENVLLPEYKDEPEDLLNEVVGIVQQKSEEIRMKILERVNSICETFREESGLNYSIENIDTNFRSDVPDIQFTPNSLGDVLQQSGQKISSGMFSVAALGSVAGAIVGGIGGFIAGGPVGLLAGIFVGQGSGRLICQTVGMAKGAADALRTGGKYNPANVSQVILQYLTRVITCWKNDKQRLINELSQKCVRALRDAIRESTEKLQADIQMIQENERASAEERRKMLTAMKATKQEFSTFVVALEKLLQIKVDSTNAPAPSQLNKDTNTRTDDTRKEPESIPNKKESMYGTIPDLDE